MDPRPLAFSIMAVSSLAWADDGPVVNECHEVSEIAPDGCICVDEDRLIDAVAELRACRKNKNVVPQDSSLGWGSIGIALLAGVLGIIIKGVF